MIVQKINTISEEYSIEKFDEFAELLHDRLHAVLFHFEEMEGKFTLFTNLLDRSKHKISNGIRDLVYAGTNAQRRILEEYKEEDDDKRNKSRDSNWAFLRENTLSEDMEDLATYKVYDKFINGGLTLDFCSDFGYLKEYFEVDSNPFQTHERAILGDYFNISKDSGDAYVSIPIIAFGTIDGVVHIVFSPIDEHIFRSPKTIRRIIKQFTSEYEGMLLDWDVAYNNREKQSEIKNIQRKFDEEYVRNHPILKQLKLFKYYQISDNYLNKRVDISDTIPDILKAQKKKIMDQHRQNAIITILIDSFAHNISTHSMTTLTWWYKEWSDLINALKTNDHEIIKKYRNSDTQNPLIQYYKNNTKTPLAREMYPFLRFLSEKATFWNAITRRTNFTGQTLSLYQILWNDFINNPLYLGTIANTENVNKIHFKISFYKEEKEIDKFLNKKIKKISKNGKCINGIIATVDLNRINANKAQNKDEVESVFVHKGEAYDILKDELSNCLTFFPGGLIGKHSFLTILENEIRNIKHFKGKVREQIKEDGLILHISIHERPVNPKRPSAQNELYKIGVWLEHPSKITMYAIEDRHKKLYSDIITGEEDKYRPKLGGTFQDKICAAMLFNNHFINVEKQVTKKDKLYYPWIKSAVSLLSKNTKNEIIDFEISSRKYHHFKEEFQERYKAFNGEQDVYFKKYFHLWKGGTVFKLQEKINFSWDNLIRYKFILTSKKDGTLKAELINNGIIRIVEADEINFSTITLSEVYQKWLNIWLKQQKNYSINFIEGNTLVGKILYDYEQESIEFQKKSELGESQTVNNSKNSEVGNIDIRVEHGGRLSLEPHIGNYRSYGVLLRKFFKSSNIATAKKINPVDLYELFESIITKICIFDDRVISRLPQEKIEKFYSPVLGCDFYREDKIKWNQIKKDGFNKFHCLVIHLTFIENMEDEHGIKYGEERIHDFIANEILPNIKLRTVKNNFKIVITTGRGRDEWWEQIKKSKYAGLVTFRPIESILDAIEDAIQINDDIDLKYNLMKILLGS